MAIILSRIFGYQPIEQELAGAQPDSKEWNFLKEVERKVAEVAKKLNMPQPRIAIGPGREWTFQPKHECWCCGTGFKPGSLFDFFHPVAALPSLTKQPLLLLNFELGHTDQLCEIGWTHLIAKELTKQGHGTVIRGIALTATALLSLQGIPYAAAAIPLYWIFQSYVGKRENERVQKTIGSLYKEGAFEATNYWKVSILTWKSQKGLSSLLANFLWKGQSYEKVKCRF